MQWINEKDLAIWARRTDARTLLIDMVADLIRATVHDADLFRFRFPGGDAGQLRGWDGDLDVSKAFGLIPAGKSKWEFGVGAGAMKASKDYKKRTGETSAKVMAESALVLVNLEAWDTPRIKLTEWEEKRNAEGKWREVKYIDAVTLVHWLDSHPAIAAKYARNVLGNAPKEGALSTDEYWDEFSSQFSPRISEKVVIGDRQKFADELLEKLLGPANSIMIGAEIAEDVVSFAVAAIRCAESEKRALLESRVLIVRTEPAARELSSKSGLIFIATKGAEPLAGLLSNNCPTLSAVTGTLARKYTQLQRSSASGMVEGFMQMGLDRNQGYKLAQRCGRSLTILKRLIHKTPPIQPEWMPQTVKLKPAFLAGGWSSDAPMDCELLKSLGNFQSYNDLEDILMPMLALPDRPIDKVATVWQVRAPVDAFYFYGQQVTDADLKRFRDAIIKVFGHVVQTPSQKEEFRFAYAAPTDYSQWLRDGLALTLVIIAAMHDIAELHINGMTPQQYVDEIVAALPDWGKNHRSLIGLENQTALFAEAAPNTFLKALESMLDGFPDELGQIFIKEKDSLFGPPSPHTYVLWALETIAWDPRYLNRATLALAKLAQLDPDPESNFTNRPLNSLRAILLGWSPNTYALQTQRIMSIDAILKACPQVGWLLLVKLLPKLHDINEVTARPKIRDFMPKVSEKITYGMLQDFESAIVNRALVAAGNNEDRIIVLINTLASLQPDSRKLIFAHVDNYLKTYQKVEGCEVWYALKKEVSRHECFSDADWSMKPEELALFTEIIERNIPADPLAMDRQSFDDCLPVIGKNRDGANKSVDPDQMRKEVLERVLLRDGVKGILRLAQMVKLPALIVSLLEHTSISMEQMFELLQKLLDQEILLDLAFRIAAVGVVKFDEQWKNAFTQKILIHVQDDSIKAKLLLNWPQDEETWRLLDSLGSEVCDQYWLLINRLPVHSTIEQLQFAIDQLRKRHRDIEVLCFVYDRIKDLPTDLILDLLIKGVFQVDQVIRHMGTMLPYYVTQALEELRSRPDIQEVDIARIEYAFLPVLEFQEQPLSIIGIMARDPELFVDILSHVYRGKNVPLEEAVTEKDKTRANISFKLLMKFKTVPGINGMNVEFDVLTNWVSQARNLATNKDLLEVCDNHIGQLLAHSPLDPEENFWPPSAVCNVIEGISSDDLEQGFRIECFNKRGVYGKAINEGGDQERDLAEKYQRWADNTLSFPRTSAALASIAEEWRLLAVNEDIRAEQGKLKG